MIAKAIDTILRNRRYPTNVEEHFFRGDSMALALNETDFIGVTVSYYIKSYFFVETFDLDTYDSNVFVQTKFVILKLCLITLQLTSFGKIKIMS